MFRDSAGNRLQRHNELAASHAHSNYIHSTSEAFAGAQVSDDRAVHHCLRGTCGSPQIEAVMLTQESKAL